MDLTKLSNLAVEALKKVDMPTFKLEDVQVKPSGTGNVGFRVVTSTGVTVTFWKSTMEDVVEAIDEKTFKIKPGVQIAAGDGGLIPASAVSGGFWK